MKFRLIESKNIENKSLPLVEDDIPSTDVQMSNGKKKMDLHIYIDDSGRAFIFDGQKLIEIDKGAVSQQIRGEEGWGKGDDGDPSDDKGDEGDEGDEGEGAGNSSGDDGGDEGDEGDDGGGGGGGETEETDSPKKPSKGGREKLFDNPMKGGGSGAKGKDWQDLEEPNRGNKGSVDVDADIDFDLDEIGKGLLRKILDNQAEKHQKEVEIAQRELEKKTNPNGAVVRAVQRNISDLISKQIRDREVIIQKLKDDRNQDYGEDERVVRTEIEDDTEIPNKPLCFVYVDSSGSCWNPQTQDVITQCTSAFDQFRDLKNPENSKIDYEFYFFSDDVSKSSSNGGGGTEWGPVMRHIQGNNEYERVPDNVVIVTDGDLQNQHHYPKFTIPGAVWTICVNRADKYLVDPRFQSQCDLQGYPMQGWTINVKGSKSNLK